MSQSHMKETEPITFKDKETGNTYHVHEGAVTKDHNGGEKFVRRPARITEIRNLASCQKEETHDRERKKVRYY